MEKLPARIAEAIGSIDAAITICDADFKLLYMNEKSALTFGGKSGAPLIRSSLIDCHKPRSVEKMREILASGKPNVYTIAKNGIKKLIWQAPWEKDGTIGGLVEISIPLPESLPHYDRS
ncbi:MAG TPA: hypothetical protein VN445_02755 [Rectinemataceae bacterium]|nr:hypothetical protein [Rectinemataceae bacterium]